MEIVRKILNPFNFLVSLSVIGTLIWFHGYQYQPHYLHPHLLYLKFCFYFYILQFSFRASLSGNVRDYLRRNRLECFLFSMLIVELLLRWLMDFSILQFLLIYTGIENHDHVFILSLHVWLLFIVGIELGKTTIRSTIWKVSPPILFILSFVVLVVIGSSLLMLPEMTVDKQGMPFIDALFTSISANCVTGLIVVDTATFFSLKGKILILLLIQIGGLNIIAFATFFISFFRRSVQGKRHQATIKELLHTDNLARTKTMVRMVVSTSLIIEFFGSIVLYQQWGPEILNQNEQIFYSVFHSVSAFNNAGFTLFSDGLTHSSVNGNFPIHITIAVLIVLGGLGFTTLQDMFQLKNIYRLFKERKYTLPVQSRIALYCSSFLIITSALLYLVLEWDNTLSHQTAYHGVVTSFFQSITARTAGFNTVDFGSVTNSILVMTMILMFIGASSGSTGGGIKTSTLSVLIMALWKRKLKRDNYGNSFLTIILVRKALTLFLYSIALIALGTFLLVLVESDKTIMELLFEEISAFGTVGLSTGITSELSFMGKSIIMVSMFIGRIGPLALAYTLVNPGIKPAKKGEKGIMIG